MKFMRILPDTCASTLCPFSSSTRNMAFGSGSTTVPSTKIVSSFGLARGRHPLEKSARQTRTERARSRPNRVPDDPKRKKLRHCEYFRAVLGDGDRVFEMGRSGTV